ncbi:50S ribosomal protein L16 3-hydroxylase [Ferrimonas sediminum]|uniref:50S ribosomal protein L16 3-hydroxylase n=1 Tax=Ferrimonas sediminum TaxID=718193 RepID=A0A1G8NE77_9GAMM|nr:cupin domain-containing protein [Ferrimonas sediminum]SDI78396.1 50S ribosomal protein L16 3-hydroxylase [Ferrimonas sediminum]
MYSLQPDNLDAIRHHWQHRPLYIPTAFADFVDPLEPDEVAGVALEEAASSRVVIQESGQWRAEPGPIEDFSRFGDQGWQLLVQAVNHFVPAAAELAYAFRFLPDWRFDDLMVSFAVPGGGVGPHIDNYDVFIIQGQGRRRWQVGDRGRHRPRPGHQTMALVEDFDAIIDVEMAPGDLLYIPPGYPHCGQTLAPSLSYSVGFRAPSQQELIGQLADHLQDQDLGNTRFVSSTEPTQPQRISLSHQQGMAKLINQLMADPDTLGPMLGTLLSQNRFELDLQPPQPPLTLSQLQHALQHGAHLQRVGGLKCLQLEGDDSSLFLDGQRWALPGSLGNAATDLARYHRLEGHRLTPLLACPKAADELLQWVNQGYWYLDDDDRD